MKVREQGGMRMKKNMTKDEVVGRTSEGFPIFRAGEGQLYMAARMIDGCLASLRMAVRMITEAQTILHSMEEHEEGTKEKVHSKKRRQNEQ
jgi:hypothetical protein